MSKVIIDAISQQISMLLVKDISTGYGGSTAFRSKLDTKPTALDLKGAYLFDIKDLEKRIAIASKQKSLGNRNSLLDFQSKYNSNFSSPEILKAAKNLVAKAMKKAIESSKANKQFATMGGTDVVVFNNFNAANRVMKSALNNLVNMKVNKGVEPEALSALLNVFTRVVEPEEGDMKGRGDRVWDVELGHLIAASTIGRYNANFTYISNKLNTDDVYKTIEGNFKEAQASLIKERISQVIQSLAYNTSAIETYKKDILEKGNKLDVVTSFRKSVGPGGVEGSLSMSIVLAGPQSSAMNQAYGSILGTDSTKNPIRNLVQNLENEFTRLKSSPSIEDMISTLVDNTLEGIKTTKKYSTTSKVTKSIPTKKAPQKAALQKIKLPTLKIIPVTSKNKIKDSYKVRQQGKFSSLASVIAIINSELSDRIRSNMGKGGSKSILNYRSGRFANSAKILKLDITRDNAISVMYTYMKYPYQTFEPGFKQGIPSSRDPRLLIQRSIRQIVREKFQTDLNLSFNRI